jgi:ribonuclease D
VSSPPTIVDTRSALVALAARAGLAERIALDLEANGRFAYRARVSTLQLAWADEVVVVDPLAPDIGGDLAPLGHLLGGAGPVKVIHDVGFDARLLTEAGIALGNVHDTALLAHWLGRASTGLASVAASELGVTLDKSLQAQDWSARPLSDRSVQYLASDVVHLLSLDDKLWGEAEARGIVGEVLDETEYRLASAARAVREPDPRPAFARAKGVDALSWADRAVFRRLVMAREAEAERMDTPAGELVPTAVLLAIARARPATLRDLGRIKSPVARRDPARVAEALLAAVALGVGDGDLSPADRAWFEPQKLSPPLAKARRERDGRLSAWRKAEAVARSVHEQVVLPGHCATDIVDENPGDLEALAAIPGVGARRVARYGAAILAALGEPDTP